MITSKKLRVLLIVGLACLVTLAGSISALADQREAVPPPVPDYGKGLSVGQKDMEMPYRSGIGYRPDPILSETDNADLLRRLLADSAVKEDDIGGDDKVLNSEPDHRACSIDIASNGDIYVALETGPLTGEVRRRIRLYRSQDGGDTWDSWGHFVPLNISEEYKDPDLHIAEGSVDRLYIAYAHIQSGVDTVIEVAYSELTPVTPVWTKVEAFAVSGVNFYDPKITSDVVAWDSFFLYLSTTGMNDAGGDIWYSRSTNQGTSYETPYIVAESILDDRGYEVSDISYGYGGYVHIAWQFRDYDDTSDTAVRYRRTDGYGSGGYAAWDPINYLTPNWDAIWDRSPTVKASATTTDVLVIHRRYDGVSVPLDPGQFVSHDQGATFPVSFQISNGMVHPNTLIEHPVSGNWILAGGGPYPWGPTIQTASAAAPTVWSTQQEFVDDNDVSGTVWSPAFALDPTRDDRIATTWVDVRGAGLEVNRLMFDAEWRSDPGYPNLESHFPVELDHNPFSPPALVDLTGNGTKEIVYGDNLGRIQAFYANGYPVPGFPIITGHPLSDGPVAVGALTPGGQNFIVAGTDDGWVFAYHADGTPADGWPINLGTGASVYVSLGSLGSPWVRLVVIGHHNELTYRDYRGRYPTGLFHWTFYGDRFVNAPAAIGDIDGDGVNEVVVGPGNSALAFDPRVGSTKMSRSLSGVVSDAITLGDLDQDGEVEIIVPTDVGILYVLQEDGTDFNANFPFTTPTETPLTSAAMGNFLGTSEPEIVVAARNWTVHAFYGHSGAETLWSPYSTTPAWYVYGAPVIGRLDINPSGVVIGDRGPRGWAWDNTGDVVPGWPVILDNRCNLSPAIGDLDNDGLAEVVFLTEDQLLVYELNQSLASAASSWPMYAHNPQRTGCLNCPEDLVTPVEEESGASFTRVSFAQPSPNPMFSTGTFQFAVPIRSTASLQIYDLRGRLVRTVLREEVEIGARIVSWDGRDDTGREIAAGQYLARLKVRGPGVNEEMVRKVMVLR